MIELGGLTLSLRCDTLGLLFSLAFSLAAILALLYGLNRQGTAGRVAVLAVTGCSLGAVLAEDWITLLVFWQALAIPCAALVWLREGGGGAESAPYCAPSGNASERMCGAGMRLLLAMIFGGGMLFAGIALHLGGGGDPALGPLPYPLEPAGWLILGCAALNAAVPPLHAWLTDAVPECTPAGSVVLAVFPSSVAVCVLLRAFPGAEPLAAAGAFMALYGAVYAARENDIRRLLSYNAVSQTGFILAGVGLGSPLALNGAAAHAFCHILTQALLFMSAGAVVYAAGSGKLTELGGLAVKLKGALLLFLVGALSLCGLPPFCGFISRSLTLAAAQGRPEIALALELASAGAILSVGLRLPYFAFFGIDRGLTCRPVPRAMTLAMSVAAVLATILGATPALLYNLLPHATSYEPYTLARVVAAVELHLGATLGFILLAGFLGPEPLIALDADRLYRRPLSR